MHPDKRPGDVWLNLGCGIHAIGGFINIDKFFTFDDLKNAEGAFANAIVDEGAEFVQADMCDLPFPDDYADYIMCCYAIEHLDMSDVIPALAEWRRVLKTDGELFISTIDFDELARLWLFHVVEKQEMDRFRILSQTIYGNQVGEGEHHRCAFNQRHLAECLAAAGFPYFVISAYETNSEWPGIRGYDCKPNAATTCLTKELHVKAYKQIPKI